MTEKNFYALFDKPTPQNLEANQHGRLTLEQRSALEQAAKSQRSVILFWGVMILAVAGFMIFFLWQVEGEDASLSLLSLVTIVAVSLGVVLLLVILSGGDFVFVFPLDDIQSGQVDSVIGRVAWMGHRYRMVSDARTLRSLTYGRVLPPPGDYRFYCLARSGLVIMAEQLPSISQTDDLLLDALARANHFSLNDLEMNRTGSLSARQELQLLRPASGLGALFLISILGGILAIQGKFFGAAPTTNFLIGLIFVFIFLRVTGWLITLVGDLWVGKVDYIEGLVSRHVHHARNMRYYTYQINNFRFNISEAAYNALSEGREYRVYFLPRSKRLVAIEPM